MSESLPEKIEIDSTSEQKQFLSRFNNPEEIATSSKRRRNDDGWGGGGGSGRGNYFKVKNSKLQQQNIAYEKKSDIFCGISIFVNGYTNPSSDELRRLICEHGGDYIHYFSKTKTTHVIATNLPHGKIKNLKANDRIVHPDWITNSVKEGKLLSEGKYLIYSAAKRDGDTINFNRVVKASEQELSIPDSEAVREEMDSDIEMGVSTFSDSEAVREEMDSDIEMGVCTFSVENESDDKISTSDHLKSYDGEKPNLTAHVYSEPSTSKSMLKAGDKNYIEEFYAHSRLHHLSMWKAELKKFAVSIKEKWKEKIDTNDNVICSRKYIMHIDLDSFFASVALKMNPELKGKPIAVCHAKGDNSEGESWSEIASCNYEARNCGLRNGMFLKDARKHCPQLVCVPYNFNEYRNVSQKFYEIISKFTCHVQAVSCDEVILDVSNLVNSDNDVLDFAETIRREVFDATECTASCGIGSSILIARLATRHAKPDGKHFVSEDALGDFILQQDVKDLPGVGYSTKRKLNTLGIKTCADLQKFPLSSLRKEFGKKFGETLYNYSRGIDERRVKTENEVKSVSAEINYGMRFVKDDELENFVRDLSSEVEKRLKEKKKKGKMLTLKLMIAQKDALNPSKYMGHGICDAMSKSCPLPYATNESVIIAETCLRIIRSLHISPADFRGIGIQITKLTGDEVNHANTRDLFQFARPTTSKELFEQHETTRLVDHQNLDTSPKKNSSIKKFISADTQKTERNGQDSDPFLILPKLPSMSFETSNNSQAVVSNWDPEVLKELPESIQIELLKQQNNELVKAVQSSARSNIEHKEKKAVGKSSTSKKSPVKRRGRNVNKKPNDSKFKIDELMISKKTSNSLPHYQISSIDFKVINELPENMRNEILAEIDNRPVQLNDKKSDKEILNAKRKSNNAAVSESLLLSPSQMDQSVLQALPQDIRDDVLNHARRIKERGGAKANVSNSTITSAASHVFSDVTDQPSERVTSFLVDEHLLPRMDMQDSFSKTDKCNVPASIVCVNINSPTPPSNSSTKKQSIASSDPQVTISNRDTSSVHNINSIDQISPHSELDISMFNALPDDIKREILGDTNFLKKSAALEHKSDVSETVELLVSSVNSNQSKEKNKNENSGTLVHPSHVNNHLFHPTLNENEFGQPLSSHENKVSGSTVPVQVKVQVKQNMPEFCGASTCIEVKNILRNWVKSYPEPLSEDINEIIDYFLQLLTSYNMENLFLFIKFLRRIVSSHSSWYEAFNKILNSVQREVKTSYTGTFPIKPLPLL